MITPVLQNCLKFTPSISSSTPRKNFVKAMYRFAFPALVLLGIALNSQAQAPTLSYPTPQSLAKNVAATITPTTTGVDAAAYGASGSIGSGINQSYGVDVDAQGNVYATDRFNNRVIEYLAGGGEVNRGTELSQPLGLAVDAVGNIYIANSGDNSIKMIAAGTNNTTTIATGFNFAFDVAVGSNGTIYLADFGANAIMQVPAGGGTPVQVGTGFSNPTGVAVDADGNVYVADQGNAKLKKIWISTDGHTEDVVTLRQPVGVVVDYANNVYVVDISNSVVNKLPGGNASGMVTIASGITQAYGLAIDGKGILYASATDKTFITNVNPVGGYYLSARLPAGLNIDQNTGIISGTPTVTSAAKDYTVTAYNSTGSTTSAFNLDVHPQTASAISSLSSLTLGGLTLSPAFDPNTTTYTAAITGGITSTSVTLIPDNPGQTLKLNGTVVAGNSTTSVDLPLVTNTITVLVTAEDGVDTKTYTITASRPTNPVFSYTNPNVLKIGTAANITLTGGGAEAAGYGDVKDFGSDFVQPWKVKSDALGNIYIADPFNFNFNTSGVLWEYPAGGGSPVRRATGITTPVSVAFDMAGNLYVPDIIDGTLLKVNAGTDNATVIASGFNNPFDVAIDKKGVLYVADFGNNTIKQIPAGGGTPVVIGTGFSGPTGLAVDAAGNVIVADQGNGKLKKIWVTTDGHTEDIADVRQPIGVTVDAANNIWATDVSNMQIDELPADGSGLIVVKSGIQNLYDINFDPKGVMYLGYVTGSSASSVTPTGGYYLNSMLPLGLNFNTGTGAITGTPLAAANAKDYTVTGYNAGGTGSATVNIAVVDNNATLSNVDLGGITLSPAFAAATTDYIALVEANVNSINVTPTLGSLSATLKINGTAVTSGTAQTIALPDASNVITLIVTAQDTSVKQTYKITVTKKIPPVLAYTGPQAYTIGTAISPLAPATATGVSALGYSDTTNTVGGGFVQPYRAKFDTAGNMFVTDTYGGSSHTGRIVEYPADGSSPVERGSGFNFPVGIDFDAAGNIYVLTQIDGIFKIDAGTDNTTVVPNSGIMYPFDMIRAKNGDMYVADFNNNAVQKLPADGSAPVQVGTGFNQPTGIALDQAGNLYVADQANGKLKKIFLTTDGHTENVADVRQPIGVAVDAENNVWVTDISNMVIDELPADGSGIKVVFNKGIQNMYFVGFDHKGNLYTNDYGASAIYKIPAVGGYYLNEPLPTGLAIDQTNGTISGTPATIAAAKNYSITAYNQYGGTSAPLTLSVNPVRLTNLAINNGTLTPAYAPNTTNYTVSVPYTSTDVSFTPTTTDAIATITINGDAATSGTASLPLSLAVGANVYQIALTTAGNTSIDTVTVTRAVAPPTVAYALDNQTYYTLAAITPNTLTTTGVDGAAYSTKADTIGKGTTFTAPKGVAVDANGTVYVADATAKTIYKIQQGQTPEVIGTSADFTNPNSLAVDSAWNVYVSDGAYVKKIVAGVTGAPQVLASDLSNAHGVAVDTKGNIYAADYAGGNIYKIPADGSAHTTIASGLNAPESVAVDGNGNVFYTEPADSKVTEIPVNGTAVQVGTGITTPAGLSVSPAGDVYITDASSKSIKRILAGNAATQTVSTYTFQQPAALAIGNTGNLYTLDNSNTVITELKPTGGIYLQTQLPAGLNFNTQTGEISGTPTMAAASKNYNVIGYNGGGGTVATTNFTIVEQKLIDLALTSGTLSPAFNTDSLNYTATVPNGITGLSITPTASDPGTTININGTVVSSGAQSPNIDLTEGSNSISVVVSGQNGVTKTYHVAVTRTPAALLNLTLNGAALSPAFNTATLTYTASVNYATTSVSFTPVTNDYFTFITYNGTPVSNGSTSAPIALNPGDNTLVLVLNKPDGSSVDYTITVTRRAAVPPPVISYGPAQTYLTNTAITPIVPSNANVALAGYAQNRLSIGSLNTPSGISTDAAGDVFVANIGTASVYKITPGSNIPVVLNSNFNTPFGLVSDAAGNVYVTDLGADGILKISATDHSISQIGIGLLLPNSIAIDPTGNYLYVTETSTHSLKKIRISDGTTTTLYSTFNNPYGVAVDSKNNIYVADIGDGDAIQSSILKISGVDNSISTVGSGFYFPTSLSVDAQGSLFVADGGFNAVLKLNPQTGVVDTVAKNFAGLFGVSVDAKGNVFTSDNVGQVIEETKPAGGYFVSPTLPDGLALDANTGIISGTPTTVTPARDYTITAYNEDSGSTATVNLQVISALANTNLTSLTLNPGLAITPINRNNGAVNYVATTNYGVTSASVTPVAQDPLATIRVNGQVVASGGTSANIPLSDGPTVINTIVTAQDGVTTKTYSITVSRVGSGDASLSSVTLDGNPVMVQTSVTNNAVAYVTSVPYATVSTTVTPVSNDPAATITVNGAAVASGSASAPISLATTSTAIKVVVTSQNGIIIKTYTITVSRTKPNNSSLTSIKLNPSSTLVRGTSTTDVINYTTSVDASETSVALIPIAQDVNAVIKVNGNVVANGQPSASIVLNDGPTTISTIVTSSDGTSTKTYNVVVNRTGSSNAALATIKMNPNSALVVATRTGNTVEYTTSVDPATQTVTLTPTALDPNAVITVEGNVVASGAASAALAVSNDPTVLHIVSTAPDGTVKYYNVTVTKVASNNTTLSSIKVDPGSTPVLVSHSGNVATYTASVDFATTVVTIKPTAEDANATITVNGEAVASGAASGPITLSGGPTTVTVVVTAQDGTTIKTNTIVISRIGNNNVNLAYINLTPASTLTRVASTGAITYTTSVDNSEASVVVTAKATDPNATITINGVATANGSPSAPILLAVGQTQIVTQVKASDGTTTRTYIINVFKAGSSNTNLTSIKLSTGSLLVPGSHSGTVANYTTTVDPGTQLVSVTSVTEDPLATITINGTVIPSGTASMQLEVNNGLTTIPVVVTAQDGTVRTYNITISRTGSNNALASLSMDPASTILLGTHTGVQLNYTTSVPVATTSVRLTVKAQDPNATITLNGAPAISNVPSAPITLNDGPTTITAVVTAQDGVTSKTYSVVVNRLGSNNATLISIKLNPAATLTTVNNTPAEVDYSTTVSTGTSSVTVTPKARGHNTSITVNGNPVASGAESDPITLSLGLNVITVIVVAEDGTTVKTYSIIVNRPGDEEGGFGFKSTIAADNTIMGKSDVAELKVHEALSPNGDGLNDVLQIDGISNYPDNTLSIINSTGNPVAELKNYDNINNVFDGHGKSGTLQKPGTYFYVLEYKDGKETKRKTGYIILKY